MLRRNRLFWSGTFSATLYWFLSEMFSPIMSLYASSLSFSPLQISLIFAAQTFVPFLFTIQIGFLSDRIGQRNMLAIGAAFMIAGGTLLLFFDDFWILLFVQTIVGLGHISIWLSSQSIVTFVDQEHREAAISRMSFFTAFGQLAGPLFGGIVFDHLNVQWVFASYLLLSFAFLLAYPFCPTTRNDRTEKPDKRTSLIGTYKIGGQLYAANKGIQTATMISFSLAFILFIRVSYLPLYLEHQSFSPTAIGLLVALWSLASIAVRPFAATLLHRFGRYRTTSAALILSLAGLLGFTVLPFTAGLILSLILAGVGTGLNQPLAISLVSTSTDDRNRGLGMGLRLMSNRMANWMCPISLGAASHFVGLAVSFAVVSIPLAVISYSSIRMLGKIATPGTTTIEE